MTDAKLDKFAAVDATLGYLYQVRSALLWTLKRLKSEPDFLVGIETLDDVAFESGAGDPRELLQTKHHRNTTASLTDASTCCQLLLESNISNVFCCILSLIKPVHGQIDSVLDKAIGSLGGALKSFVHDLLVCPET